MKLMTSFQIKSAGTRKITRRAQFVTQMQQTLSGGMLCEKRLLVVVSQHLKHAGCNSCATPAAVNLYGPSEVKPL